MHDQSPALITWIEVENSKRMSAHHFPEMLCSMIASTWATLKKLQVSTLENINIDRTCRSLKSINTKTCEIENSDCQALVDSPDIDDDDIEVLKLQLQHSAKEKLMLKRYYLRKTYCITRKFLTNGQTFVMLNL